MGKTNAIDNWHLYSTSFNLLRPVNNFDAASDYLDIQSHNMTDILKKCEPDIANKIAGIRWELTGTSEGNINLLASQGFSGPELAVVSRWVYDQNCNGLGKHFGQQPFANMEGPASSFFDWNTNDYIFTDVTHYASHTIADWKKRLNGSDIFISETKDQNHLNFGEDLKKLQDEVSKQIII